MRGNANISGVNNTPFKITNGLLDVLAVLASGGEHSCLDLIHRSGRNPATVYTVLDVLREAGWVQWRWENGKPPGVARLRFYWLSGQRMTQAKMVLAENVRLDRMRLV